MGKTALYWILSSTRGDQMEMNACCPFRQLFPFHIFPFLQQRHFRREHNMKRMPPPIFPIPDSSILNHRKRSERLFFRGSVEFCRGKVAKVMNRVGSFKWGFVPAVTLFHQINKLVSTYNSEWAQYQDRYRGL